MIRTIYGFDDLGRKVPTGSYDDGLKAVGGRIFYIDSNSDETVKFYDSSFNELSNVAVGDTPSYYKVTSAGISGKEKYYVYNQELKSGNDRYWGYYNITTGATNQNFGYGKSNTSIILAIEDTSQYSYSYWTWLKEQNNNSVNGCNDWYIGTKSEYITLKNYIDNNADGTIIENIFTNDFIITSTEYNAVGYIFWNKSGWWDTNKDGYSPRSYLIRSF